MNTWDRLEETYGGTGAWEAAGKQASLDKDAASFRHFFEGASDAIATPFRRIKDFAAQDAQTARLIAKMTKNIDTDYQKVLREKLKSRQGTDILLGIMEKGQHKNMNKFFDQRELDTVMAAYTKRRNANRMIIGGGVLGGGAVAGSALLNNKDASSHLGLPAGFDKDAASLSGVGRAIRGIPGNIGEFFSSGSATGQWLRKAYREADFFTNPHGARTFDFLTGEGRATRKYFRDIDAFRKAKRIDAINAGRRAATGADDTFDAMENLRLGGKTNDEIMREIQRRAAMENLGKGQQTGNAMIIGGAGLIGGSMLGSAASRGGGGGENAYLRGRVAGMNRYASVDRNKVASGPKSQFVNTPTDKDKEDLDLFLRKQDGSGPHGRGDGPGKGSKSGLGLAKAKKDKGEELTEEEQALIDGNKTAAWNRIATLIRQKTAYDSGRYTQTNARVSPEKPQPPTTSQVNTTNPIVSSIRSALNSYYKRDPGSSKKPLSSKIDMGDASLSQLDRILGTAERAERVTRAPLEEAIESYQDFLPEDAWSVDSFSRYYPPMGKAHNNAARVREARQAQADQIGRLFIDKPAGYPKSASLIGIKKVSAKGKPRPRRANPIESGSQNISAELQSQLNAINSIPVGPTSRGEIIREGVESGLSSIQHGIGSGAEWTVDQVEDLYRAINNTDWGRAGINFVRDGANSLMNATQGFRSGVSSDYDRLMGSLRQIDPSEVRDNIGDGYNDVVRALQRRFSDSENQS